MSDKVDEHTPTSCCGACEFAAAVEKDPSLAPVNHGELLVATPTDLLRITGFYMMGPIDKTFLQPAIKIGRVKGNDLVVDDPTLSRFTCEITMEPNGGVMIQDTKSACGTYVNGVSIRVPTALRQGDIIQVGSIKLEASVVRRG
jgi:hypothetical protein